MHTFGTFLKVWIQKIVAETGSMMVPPSYKKNTGITCFAHVLLIAVVLIRSEKSSDKDDVCFWVMVGWCFEAAQDDLVSGLAAVVGFPSSRIRIDVRWGRKEEFPHVFFFFFWWGWVFSDSSPKEYLII